MIFLIIPAYNEEGGIKDVCEAVHRQITSIAGAAHRICVVDDGSTDGTAGAVRRLAAVHPEITLISHERNFGVPKAFYTGIDWALRDAGDSDIIIFIEADMTNDPALIPSMHTALIGATDVVIASRMMPGGAYVGFPAVREVMSRFGNVLLRWRFRVPGVTDYTIFFRAYRASRLRAMFDKYKDELFGGRGFTVNTRILLKLHAQRATFSEVPHKYNYDLKKSHSKMSILRNVMIYGQILVSRNR